MADKNFDPAAPATPRQLITLAALTGRDWQGDTLTQLQAHELIIRYTDTPNPEADANLPGDGEGEEGEEQERADGQKPAAAPAGEGDDVILRALRESVSRIAKEYGLEVPVTSEAVDEKIREIVGAERRIHVVQEPTFPDGEQREHIVDNAHKNFPELVELVTDRQHVMLIGPTGGGKTTAAMHAATCISDHKGNALAFFAKPCTMTDTSSDWFGYNSAHGYEPSLFRRAYENGGLFVAEEIDAGNPSITTGIHMAVENGVGAFPDKMVEMHPDFRFISTANTWGHGADRQYVGRNPLDAATTDRFWQMDWDYDEQLERALAVRAALAIGDEYEKMAHGWVSYVQMVRKNAFEAKEHIVISPRASIRGARAIARGRLDRVRIEEMLLWRNTKDSVRARLSRAGK